MARCFALLVSPSQPSRFKSELTRSLKTTNGRAAKRLVTAAIDHAEHLCEIARRLLGIAQSVEEAAELSPEASTALANQYHAAVLMMDEELRKIGMGIEQGLMLEPGKREPGMSPLDLARYDAFVADREAELRQAIASARAPRRTKQAASVLLSAASINIPDGTPERRDVELDFLAAERRAMGDVRARLSGAVVSTPPLSNQQGPLLSATFERWAKGDPVRGGKKPREATVAEGRTILRRFIELHGDMPIRAITKQHSRELLIATARVPKGIPPSLRKLKLPALLKQNLIAYTPRAAATINKTMQILGGVMVRAEKDGFFDGVVGWSNPFHIALDVNELEKEPYQPFDIHELNKLFASPVFANKERPVGGRGDAAYWLPLLGLFTGARRTELAQLRASDIQQNADTGVWFFNFHSTDGNTLKTRAARRKTPVHPKLIGLGLIAYAQRRLEAGGTKAPLLTGFAQPVGPKVKSWTKWFSRYLAAHVVDHPSKSFHSFRGTFKRFARAAGCEEHVVDVLVGHASDSVGRKYGRSRDALGTLDAGFPLEKLSQEISRVQFPAVRFASRL